MSLSKEDGLPLNYQQNRFVEEYIRDPSSPSKAAIRAGYSIDSASATGSRLLQDPRVKELLEAAREKAADTLGITLARILQELAVIAFANPGDAVTTDEDGSNVDLATLPKDKTAGMEISVTSTSGRNKSRIISVKTVKPSDKLAALIQIQKLMNMIPKEEVKVEHTGSLRDLIEESLKPKEDA